MKTIQMTLNEELVSSVDRAVKKLRTTRSEFTRQALRAALKELEIREMEERHRAGYKKKPVKRGEFSVWESHQVWVE